MFLISFLLNLTAINLFYLGPGTHDLTYSRKNKMSQRQKRNRVHQGTQTEEIYFSDYHNSRLAHLQMNGEGEYYEEQGQLYERLLKAEEVRKGAPAVSYILL